jgi:hypothetical protein
MGDMIFDGEIKCLEMLLSSRVTHGVLQSVIYVLLSEYMPTTSPGQPTDLTQKAVG